MKSVLLLLLSRFSRVRLCATPETAAHQAPRPWDSPGKNTGMGCHFLLQCMKGKSESEVAQSYPTLSDPMDCSQPGSSVHGIFQARVLEWGAIAFSGNQLYICIYTLFFRPPSHIGHYRVFTGVPCAIQHSYLFIYSSVHMSISFSPFIPPPFPPWLLGGPAYSRHMTVREAEGC